MAYMGKPLYGRVAPVERAGNEKRVMYQTKPTQAAARLRNLVYLFQSLLNIRRLIVEMRGESDEVSPL